MGLRERYRMDGPTELGDAELLALVLETGCAGRSAREIAADLLEVADGAGNLGDMPAAAVARVKGIGPARAVRILAAVALGRRSLAGSRLEEPVTSAVVALGHFRPRLLGLQQEELHGLFLNRRNAVLSYRVLSRGNDAHTIVDPRQVFRAAVAVGASAVVVAHNHPSGDPAPSLADVEVTHRLAMAGQLLGIEVLDHLILAGDGYRSFREEGLLTPAASAPAWVASDGGDLAGASSSW
jgi:DNA repair protein RadC